MTAAGKGNPSSVDISRDDSMERVLMHTLTSEVLCPEHVVLDRMTAESSYTEFTQLMLLTGTVTVSLEQQYYSLRMESHNLALEPITWCYATNRLVALPQPSKSVARVHRWHDGTLTF